jgi:hypothetical protein
MAKARKRAGRPPSGLERVKFFARVAPVDVELFRAIGAALTQAELRRVTDAEVFRSAVRALAETLPAAVRSALPRSARG